MVQPVWCSIQRLTASAARTMVRWASIESRLRWQAGRACRSFLAIREGSLDLEELVVGADHELGGHWRAVRTRPQVRDVALQPGQGAGLLLEVPVDLPGAAGQLDEPVPLDRRIPGDGLLGLADLLAGAAHGAAGSVSLVLVVDDLVAAPAARPGRPGLGEDVPVGDLLAGMLAPPPGHYVGDVRDPGPEDERQARGLDGLLVRFLRSCLHRRRP